MLAQPELMAPAGGWPQLQTAIEAGADAVYFGLEHFSARAKVGFSIDELPEVMETLHQRGVRGFLTFNTIVFDHELKQAEQTILKIAQAGVDAVIVQDVGIAQLIGQIAPRLPLHGSTQMSVTSAQGAEFARSLGCRRVVLGRELSLNDIRKIAEATDVELEVFVHGALCVSYSGQCFSSEAWGGRSANRGQCAQACRLSYDLIVDGEPRELGAARYLLSPGDLFALEQIPELIEIGVACLKIEGRYKGPDYVALTTRAYREAIDLAKLGVPSHVTDEEKRELEQVYSRGLGSHFISGVNHQRVVTGRAPRHRGVHVGRVVAVRPGGGSGGGAVEVKMECPIERGDGLVFDAADWRSPDEPEEGGNVYEVTPATSEGCVRLEFGRHEIDFSRIRVGDWVWRTKDPKLTKRLKSITQTEIPLFTRPIRFEVTATGGLPLRIDAYVVEDDGTGVFLDASEADGAGATDAPAHEGCPPLRATYTGQHPLAAAEKRPIDLETLTEKLGRLGGTPFHLDRIELLTDDAVFVRTSELNQARRQLVDELFFKGGEPRPIPARPALAKMLDGVGGAPTSAASRSVIDSGVEGERKKLPKVHLLVRTPQQLEGAIEVAATCPIASITLDYLDLYGLRPSVAMIRDAGIRPRVASPRILKPSEQNVIRFLDSLQADIVIRSSGLLYDLMQGEPRKGGGDRVEWIGDFSLNAANALSCHAYLKMGLDRITPTYDLNAAQIVGLTEHLPSPALEVIAYSHLPVFHTEHCLFCRFLSEGTDHTNCGHPCEKHQVGVRDHRGRLHPVMADVGCRNTVFGAEAQTDPDSLGHWQRAGIEHYRLEFVHQTPEQLGAIVAAFGDFFGGSGGGVAALRNVLRQHSPQQTTVGSFFVPDRFKPLVSLQ